MEQAIFGGGCFWCLEAVFKSIKGVILVVPGYAGGTTKHPNYAEVSGSDTGHAEVVRITFDPTVLDYKEILTIFFSSHDPTTLNRQGNDVGSQYRSIIIYINDKQRQLALETITGLEKEGVYKEPIVTELKAYEVFYEAEEYHHDYFGKNPNNAYCMATINPKLSKIRTKYSEKMKE